MFRFLERTEPYSQFAVRSGLAALFLFTGIKKAFDITGTSQFFANLGFPYAEYFAVFVMAVELLGGTLLLFGMLTRISAFLLSSVLITAIIVVGVWQWGTPDAINLFRDIALLGATLTLILSGPGRISLDYVLGLELV